MVDSANDEPHVAQLSANPVATDWQEFTRPAANLTSGICVISERVDPERSLFYVSGSASDSIGDCQTVHFEDELLRNWLTRAPNPKVYHHLTSLAPVAILGLADDSDVRLFPPPAKFDSYEDQLSRRAESIVTRIANSLREDSEDGEFANDDIPTQAAIDACCDLAAKLSLFLATHTELMLAAFPDEGGQVSLIIHSNTTKRRATFVVDADGRRAQISRLDKSLQAKHDRITLPDARGARELAKWVTGGGTV